MDIFLTILPRKLEQSPEENKWGNQSDTEKRKVFVIAWNIFQSYIPAQGHNSIVSTNAQYTCTDVNTNSFFEEDTVFRENDYESFF